MELVVVMTIMAILAAVVAPRFFNSGDIEGPGFVQELAAAARYAQKLAVAGGCPVQFNITSATHYELKQGQNAPGASCDTTFTRDVLDPGSGAAFAANAPGGVAISGIALYPLTVQFAATGAPTINGVTPAASTTSVTLCTVAGRALVVNARSGLVEVQ